MERVDNYDKEHPLYKEKVANGDHNQCTVFSLAAVTGFTYLEAYKIMRDIGGRKKGKGMLRPAQEKVFHSLQGFKVKKGNYSKENRITISQFIKKHPKGKFYCASRGHAFAIIDGVLYDHSDKPRRQITFAYRFYNEQDLKELNDGRLQ